MNDSTGQNTRNISVTTEQIEYDIRICQQINSTHLEFAAGM